MSRIIIPGGSGFLGQALAARLVGRGDEVVILSRSADHHVAGTRTVAWDAESIGRWADELDGATAVVHLTGRRVDVRSTKRNVDELVSSRVQPVRLVGEAIERCASPPQVWVQSSSLAVFGDGGDAILDEHSTPAGIGPREMVTVCLAWEWVGLDDLLTAMILAIDDDTMRGTYHVTSPNPVTNAEMMTTYRRLLGRRVGLPSPAWLAHIGAPMLGSSASLALIGRRVVPTRLLDRGFTFAQPDFESAARIALDACGLL